MVAQYCHDFSDEKLLNLTCQKDPTAFSVFYERHAQTVYTFLLRIVRERETAEDLLQETFWQVWQKAEQYDGAGLPTAWLYQIARNKALDQLRRRRARPQTVQSELTALEYLPIFHQCGAEVEIERRWTQQAVVNAIKHIPDEQRQALELAFFAGLNQREIAEQTNIPLGTIKTRIHIGMEKIKRSLVGLGVSTVQI